MPSSPSTKPCSSARHRESRARIAPFLRSGFASRSLPRFTHFELWHLHRSTPGRPSGTRARRSPTRTTTGSTSPHTASLNRSALVGTRWMSSSGSVGRRSHTTTRKGFLRSRKHGRKRGAPNGNRTRVSALRGLRPRPLDDGSAQTGGPKLAGPPELCPHRLCPPGSPPGCKKPQGKGREEFRAPGATATIFVTRWTQRVTREPVFECSQPRKSRSVFAANDTAKPQVGVVACRWRNRQHCVWHGGCFNRAANGSSGNLAGRRSAGLEPPMGRGSTDKPHRMPGTQ